MGHFRMWLTKLYFLDMTYVALLRGINVGGKSKIEMARLKITFEDLGFENVKTFINSGNVIFTDITTNSKKLVGQIEQGIEKNFGLSIKVVLRDLPAIKKTVEALPSTWVNDASMKCDVMFLWEDVDTPDVMKQLPQIHSDFEEIKYIPGAILWRVDRQYASKSKMLKINSTDLYKKMTIRNCNSVRKIYALMQAANLD